MLHNYKECIKCGKRFVEVRESDLCPECRVKEEKGFAKVKELLYDSPGTNLAELADAAEVSEEDILKWQEEGKILGEIRPPVRCEVCGKAIKNGRICLKCQSRLEPDLPEHEDYIEYIGEHMHTSKKRKK